MIFWLHAAWHFIWSSATIAMTIGVVATAVAILEPKQLDAVTDLRKWCICIAVIAFSFTAVAGKFYNDGIAFTRAEWAASQLKETDQGEKARDDAVQSVGAEPSDRGVFSSDPFNRNRGGAKR